MVVDGHMKTVRPVCRNMHQPRQPPDPLRQAIDMLGRERGTLLNELEERGASGFDRWPQWAPDLATLHRTLNYKERYVLTMCMLRPMVESAA